MHRHQLANHLARPPSTIPAIRRVIGPQGTTSPSPTDFVARIVFAAIAIVGALGIVALAPRDVVLSLSAVAALGVALASLLQARESWVSRRVRVAAVDIERPRSSLRRGSRVPMFERRARG